MNYRKLTSGTLLFCSLILLGLIPRALVSSPSTPGNQATAAPISHSARGVSPAAVDALTHLKDSAKGEVTAQESRETGHYSFVSATGGVLAADDATASPQKRALAFLGTHGALVGMNEAERTALRHGAVPPAGSDLQIARTETDALGMTHVKMNQFYQGLAVFGAQVVVHMNGEGITAVNGKFVPNVSLSTIPALSQGRAIDTAMTIARKHGAGAKATPGKVELSVYAVGLLEGSPVRSVLAYSVEVSSPELHEQVWLDAQTGAVLNRIPLRHSALNRRVYTPQYDPENPDEFVVHEEDNTPPPAGVIPVLPIGTSPTSNLFHFAGHVYNFFSSAFGRDSYDGAGIMMRSVYLVNEACPNAYWNGQATNYCPEVDGDDVVAHEWGHAYTQETHDLIYSYQSGALNESYSDIWGETVDLNNGHDAEGGSNNAQPRPQGQRWQIGEDTQGINQPALGILRNMWDPTEYGNPDKVSSPLYHCDSSDGGGVHTNSGPPNHTFAMLVDGKTFNGVTVTAIGFTKAVHIYFRAMTVYQTRTTNFPEHERALKQSCADLTGQVLNGFNAGGVPVAPAVITAADCQQVANAAAATELSRPVNCKFAPLLNPATPPACDGAADIFSEDWESGDDGWTRTSEGVFEDWNDSSRPIRDFKVQGSLPAGRTGSAAFAPNPPIGDDGGGNCVPGQQDYSGQFTIDSPEITIPAGADGAHLSFEHYVATELEYDGGQLEISKNGGAYQLVPQDQYEFNPPNAHLGEPPPVGNNTNPNAGEFAWNGTNTGEQGGSWGKTVVNLAEIAKPGDKIKIRFTFSQDGCNGVDGWYIDNVRVYNCPVLEAPVLSIGSGYENPDTNGSYGLNWTRPSGASGPDTLQESTTSCGPLLFDNAEAGLTKWTVSTAGTYSGNNWQTSTEKPEHNSTTFRARAAESATNASAILTYKDPLAIPAAGTTTLTFLEWIMNESDDGGVVEVSEDGATWTAVYSNTRSDLAPFAAELYATEPLFARNVDLTSYQGKTIRLRFRYFVGPDNKAGSTPLGWYLDDIAVTNENWNNIATTNDTSYVVSGRPTGTYCYRVRSTYTFGSVTAQSPVSNVVSVNVAAGVLPPARLQNISARARVLTDDNVLIGGFIVRDSAKRLLGRAIGPSMQSGGSAVAGRLNDPTLEIYQNGNPPVLIATNDDWQENRAAIEATGLAPTDPRESAVTGTVGPGAYTAVMRGKGGETGIGLVEIYDLDSTAGSTLGNLSARAYVETDDNVLIGGFITGPASEGATKVVVRAIGPSLQSQIPDALDDTTVEVVDANGNAISSNDDWAQSPHAAEIQQIGLAPTHPKESAVMLPSLQPGPRTAIVRGVGRPRGVGLVEIYNVRQ